MDVRQIVKNVLLNYDVYTDLLLENLSSLNASLFIQFDNLVDSFILAKKTYACSISTGGNKTTLKNVWPVMIGSKLDMFIRKMSNKTAAAAAAPMTYISNLRVVPNMIEQTTDWEDADIAITCFLINGNLKQIPAFVTNDVTNVHVIKNDIVRLYRYDENEKGTQLSMFLDERNLLTLRTSTGQVIEYPSQDMLREFVQCPYPVQMKIFLRYVYGHNIDIDNLGNKITYTPGHLLYKLFRKSLWYLLKSDADKTKIRKNAANVEKMINSGDFLNVLSKKTIFVQHNEQACEIGLNNKIFMEKKSTCYRDAPLQSYPLIPYLSQVVNIKISSKVKSYSSFGFRKSYIGFLCIFGTTESKNVGKQMMLARNVFVSTPRDVSLVYKFLHAQLAATAAVATEAEVSEISPYYLVVNNACVSLDRESWNNIDLLSVKRHFLLVEAYQMDTFKIINLKQGIVFKQIADKLWISPRDCTFWKHDISFPFITSHYIDLIPYFNHNAFPKNVLALNALKHSILSVTPKYTMYYRETLSNYTYFTARHRLVIEPVDEFSHHWALYLPKIKLMFTSFRGLTQEDCIVCSDALDCFHCNKTYTLRVKFENRGTKYFRALQGGGEELGTVTCFESKLQIVPQTMYVEAVPVNDNVFKITTSKRGYYVKHWDVTADYLFVFIEKYHASKHGDKLCTLHGQKGVMYLYPQSEFPYGVQDSEKIVPEILVNPNSLISRQTMGQIFEMLDFGKDYEAIYNCKNQKKIGRALIGQVFYFLINYLSEDHLYVAINCLKDKITGQPVKGRSRQGGMRAGNMEMLNGYRGNGIMSCFREKIMNDLIRLDDVVLPKSAILCAEDAKFFKCKLDWTVEPFIKETYNNSNKRQKKCELPDKEEEEEPLK